MGSAGADLNFTTFRNVIDGKLTTTAETRHGINPATGEALPEVPVSTSADVDAAVEAGQRAFKTWSKSSYEDRKKAVLAFADAVEAHQSEFAKMLIAEQGKPVRFLSCKWSPSQLGIPMRKD
jgi:acyl-CoA reductase-like NAD-dependent aldehyde dehydrogenase